MSQTRSLYFLIRNTYPETRSSAYALIFRSVVIGVVQEAVTIILRLILQMTAREEQRDKILSHEGTLQQLQQQQ